MSPATTTAKTKRRSPRVASLDSNNSESVSTDTNESKNKKIRSSTRTRKKTTVSISSSQTSSTQSSAKKKSTTNTTSKSTKKSASPKKLPSPKEVKKVSTSISTVTTASSRKRTHLSSSRASPPPVLSSSYLENHNSKNDLVRRLREIVNELSDDDVEADSSSYPGIDGLASSLVSESYLEHKDKDVRLWTVLACMEIFYLYAPEPPWDESEILRIFSQMIRQLGNLAHCTSPTQANYHHYFRLLEQLSVVKIGCVLVEIAKGDGQEEALEVLCSLVHTLLECVHIDHPSDVSSHVVDAVSSCIEEYDETIPIPLLDQILTFIADGQVTLVTNPAAVEAAARHYSAKKAGKTPSPHKPPDQISQTNCSYVAAANVLRRTENQLSTPVANLLNSLLNSDTNISSQSQLTREQVFCIIYELHRIAPNILTTVIGHVTNSLLSSDTATRHLAVKLLGKLFQAQTSNIGTQFAACFRDWNGRRFDASPDIRMAVVKYLVLILQNNKPREMRRLATTSLKYVLSSDPDVDVRIQVIHDLCDLAYDDDGKDGVCIVVPSLLKAVGDRVRSKNKTERKDAITGLARIYYHRFIKEMTKDITVKDIADLDEDYFDVELMDIEHTEQEEEDLNLCVPNHLHQKYSWIPSIIVESACFTDSVDSDMRNRLLQIMDDVVISPSLPEHQNAIGFALFVNSLSENALKWLDTLWSSRYTLQKALDSYLTIRTELKTCNKVQKVTLEAKVMQQLHTIASLTASSLSDDAMQQVLNDIHSFKDQHVFRLLATIATSTHSLQARQRALEDLPKRLSSLGSNATGYAKTLVRRAAMGTINTSTFKTCLELAKNCLQSKNIIATNVFLNSTEVLGRSFPPLIGCHVSPLIELYEHCSKKFKTDEEGIQEIQDLLIDVFSISAKDNSLNLDAIGRKSLKVTFQNELLLILNENGEPDQCCNAVLIMASMVGPDIDSLSSLLDTLMDNDFDIHNPRLDCVLLSISSLIDYQPAIVNTEENFTKIQPVVEFLMDITSSEMENSAATKTAKKKGKKSSKGKSQVELSGDHKSNCISAALDFLVSYVRSVVISSKAKGDNVKNKKPKKGLNLSKEFISKLFCCISFHLSNDDVSENETKDVKLHAALGLMRLSDSSLGLADQNLSTSMWYSLGNIFLDSFGDVREGTLTELNNMMLGVDKYCHQDVATAPALRFLAYATLVPDIGDHSSKKHEPYHIGKYAQTLKSTTLQCISDLRKTCEQTLAQCQAISREAENNFEKRYKMNIMPEFAVPFAFYLLVYLDETPTSDEIGNDEEEKRQTLTRKRLKFLLEPLVTSLGVRADNISFLLRMVEIIGKCQPVAPRTVHIDEVPVPQESGQIEVKKLEFLSKTAREVLLKFVKKDVNLTPYPSPIFIPSALFKKKSSRTSTDGSTNASNANDLSTSQISAKSSAIKSSVRKSISSSAEKSHVSFSEVNVSPRLSSNKLKRRSLSSSSVQDPPDWGDLSPIASDPSPAKPRRLLTSTSKALTPIMDQSTPESSEATNSKVSMKSSTKSGQSSTNASNSKSRDSKTMNNGCSKRKLPSTPQTPPTPASSKVSNADQESQKSSYKEDDSDSEMEATDASGMRGGRPPLNPKYSNVSQTPSSNKPNQQKKTANNISGSRSRSATNRNKRNVDTPSSEADSEPLTKSRPLRRSPRSTLDDSSSKMTNNTETSNETKLDNSNESSTKDLSTVKASAKQKKGTNAVDSSSISTGVNAGKKATKHKASDKNKRKIAQSKSSSVSTKSSKTKIGIVTVKNQPAKKQTKRKTKVNDEFEFNDADIIVTKKTRTKA